MPKEIVIRWAAPKDGPALVAFLLECWLDTYAHIVGEDGATRFAHDSLNIEAIQYYISTPGQVTLVADDDGRIAGFANAVIDSKNQIVLYMLYVSPGLKGRGLGTAMMGAVRAQWPQATSIRVEVLRENRAAIAFYERGGFAAYAEVPDATGAPGVPAVYMDAGLKPRRLALKQRWDRWIIDTFVPLERRPPIATVRLRHAPAQR